MDTVWSIVGVRGPEDSHRVRVLTILLSFAATYVIGDMYSANLTSLLARPGRGIPPGYTCIFELYPL